MSIPSHLADLELRHSSLEHQLQEALRHPSSDDLVLADLKRRKLQIKDEIERLKSDSRLH